MSAAENFSPRIHGPFCKRRVEHVEDLCCASPAAVLAGTSSLVKICISAGSMQLGEKNSHYRYLARCGSDGAGASLASG